MDVDEALSYTDPDERCCGHHIDEAFSALAAEVERLREVVAGDGARIFALQARVIVLEEIEARARRVLAMKVDNGWDVAAAHAARVILLGENA
jgi:hypothetical protein